MMRVIQVLAFLVGLHSVGHAQDVSVAERASHAFNFLKAKNQWRRFPSDNSRYQNLSEPDNATALLFENLLKSSGLSESGFKLKFGAIGNVVCDTQRKFIIADPTWLKSIQDTSSNSRHAIITLFAHELSHYLLEAYREITGEDVFGSKPFTVMNRQIPEGDIEHAQVEPLAAELLKRASFSHEQIRDMFGAYFGWMQLFVDEMSKTLPNLDPSTDLETRKLVIKSYLQ